MKTFVLKTTDPHTAFEVLCGMQGMHCPETCPLYKFRLLPGDRCRVEFLKNPEKYIIVEE